MSRNLQANYAISFLFHLDFPVRYDRVGILNFGTKQGVSQARGSRLGITHQKLYTSITSIFEHMHGVLNIDEKNRFTQIACKLRDESL